MDLFSQISTSENAPLPHRLRPTEFSNLNINDTAIIKLWQNWQNKRYLSFIISGPPGVGKSTLLELFLNEFKYTRTKINAVDTTVKTLREISNNAQNHFRQFQEPHLLYIDEVHRLTASQQDALLPVIEDGTLILIAATTETPQFVLNRAFLSRLQHFKFKKLGFKQLKNILNRGLEELKLNSLSEKIEHRLLQIANGDARILLSQLSYIFENFYSNSDWDEASTLLHLDQLKSAKSNKTDRYHAMSALIKSMRASQVKEALIYMEYLLRLGEDPLVIYRRLYVFASEDVGLEDPFAIVKINALWRGFEKTGMPEGTYGLYHAVSLLAQAKKSRKVVEYMQAIAKHFDGLQGDLIIPDHLKNNDY